MRKPNSNNKIKSTLIILILGICSITFSQEIEKKICSFNSTDAKSDSIRKEYNSYTLEKKELLIYEFLKYNKEKEPKCQYNILVNGFQIEENQLKEIINKKLIKSIEFTTCSNNWCCKGAVIILTEEIK